MKNLRKLPESLLTDYAENMSDMTRKWGRSTIDGQSKVFSPDIFQLPGDIQFTAGLNPDNISVIVEDKGPKSDVVEFRPEALNMASVGQGRRRGIMLECDAKASQLGLRVRENRKPINVDEIVVPGRRKVNEVFSSQGTTMPIFDEDPYQVIATFDKPDELTVRIDPYSGRPVAIIKKSEVPYFAKWDQILNEVLLEQGLTVDQIASSSDTSKLMKVRAEVLRRLKKYF